MILETQPFPTKQCVPNVNVLDFVVFFEVPIFNSYVK